ncbi:MAG: nucleotidyltransferase [Planctomycetes bacterium RIFCSPHIGHO2_02_FULL_50_42]|nr:MAG: nucleotidyltransferase [Planctomycetes bacterium RIFCSPHIGHO2_02_FULL_50_42]OHB91822.1 MAG: nucleotidyltransferase [Planctomycetes bacterium RIFCSPHIGHO2_12_FULL_51_37]OHB96086.1 MAG: nucleotidyltransferase [Planctomycetes bacterium RIFCSPLOWO2_02_FULL_50_16]OHC04504.1 MAG: nucleotidyltransferase [Planctomycetes bacterium RIFCSPLOWO2_12_FULL_50_35]
MRKAHIDVPGEKIEKFCKKWGVHELSLFGSVLRDDFRPDSDIDVLVTFDENAGHSLFDMVHMEDELKVIFGRNVDIVSRRGIESSRNYIRRNAILNSAEVVYAA